MFQPKKYSVSYGYVLIVIIFLEIKNITAPYFSNNITTKFDKS